MVTLASLQGGSLVPDPSQALGILRQAFGTPQSRALEKAQREEIEARTQERARQEQQRTAIAADIDLLTGPDSKLSPEEKARIRITGRDPTLGKALADIRIRGNEEKRKSTVFAAEQQGKIAAHVLGQQGLPAKQKAIKDFTAGMIARGADQKQVSEMIDLLNLSELELDNKLLGFQTMATDVQTLLKIPEPTTAFGKIEQAFELGRITEGQRETMLDAEQRRLSAVGRPPPTRPAGPSTAIGKARRDLKQGFITQDEFNTIKATPKKFQSPVGKLIADRQLVVGMFGEDSSQVKAFDEAIESDKKGDAPKLSDVGGIRKEFTKLSGDFITMRAAIDKVNAAAETPSAAGDIALIFNFMKILDPPSTVREGEFATVQNSGGVDDRIRAQYNKLLRGERLSDNQRNDFVDTAGRLFDTQVINQRKLEASFKDIAERQGIDAENVVIDFIQGTGQKIIKFDNAGNIIE